MKNINNFIANEKKLKIDSTILNSIKSLYNEIQSNTSITKERLNQIESYLYANYNKFLSKEYEYDNQNGIRFLEKYYLIPNMRITKYELSVYLDQNHLMPFWIDICDCIYDISYTIIETKKYYKLILYYEQEGEKNGY